MSRQSEGSPRLSRWAYMNLDGGAQFEKYCCFSSCWNWVRYVGGIVRSSEPKHVRGCTTSSVRHGSNLGASKRKPHMVSCYTHFHLLEY